MAWKTYMFEYLEPCFYGDGYAAWKAVNWDIRKKFNAADNDPIIMYTEQQKQAFDSTTDEVDGKTYRWTKLRLATI